MYDHEIIDGAAYFFLGVQPLAGRLIGTNYSEMKMYKCFAFKK